MLWEAAQERVCSSSEQIRSPEETGSNFLEEREEINKASETEDKEKMVSARKIDWFLVLPAKYLSLSNGEPYDEAHQVLQELGRFRGTSEGRIFKNHESSGIANLPMKTLHHLKAWMWAHEEMEARQSIDHSTQKHRPESQTGWVQIPSLPLTSCETMGKSLNFSFL